MSKVNETLYGEGFRSFVVKKNFLIKLPREVGKIRISSSGKLRWRVDRGIYTNWIGFVNCGSDQTEIEYYPFAVEPEMLITNLGDEEIEVHIDITRGKEE